MYLAVIALFAAMFPLSVVNEPVHSFDVTQKDMIQDEIVKLSLGCSAVLVGPNSVMSRGSCYAKDSAFTFRQIEYTVRFYQSPALDISVGVYSPEIPFGVLQFATVIKSDMNELLKPKRDHMFYVYTQKSKDFIDDIIAIADAKICGLNYDCTSTSGKEKQSLWESIIY